MHDIVLTGSVLLWDFPDAVGGFDDTAVLGNSGSPIGAGFSSGRMRTVTLEFLLATTK